MTASRPRAGCWLALLVLSLAPGVALVGSGTWVRAQGGGWTVLLAGIAALALGAFVLIFIGAAMRRSSSGTVDRPAGPPAA